MQLRGCSSVMEHSGGWGVLDLPEKSVTKVYGSTLLALRGGWWVSISRKWALRNTWMAPKRAKYECREQSKMWMQKHYRDIDDNIAMQEWDMTDEDSHSLSLYRPSVRVVCPQVCGHGRITPPATVTENERRCLKGSKSLQISQHKTSSFRAQCVVYDSLIYIRSKQNEPVYFEK